MKTKHTFNIIVLWSVTNDGEVMFIIFPYGFRLNTETYIKWLDEVMLTNKFTLCYAIKA